MSLESLAPGQGGVFARVSDSDPEMLRFLAERGITLGGRLQVIDKHPFEGPVFLRIGDREVVLGGRLASSMRVELDPADDEARSQKRVPG